MILSDLRAYLQERGRAPIADLANRFDADPAAVRGMLETYIRKGRVRRVGGDEVQCGGCAKCDASQLEVYEWVG